MARSRWSAMKWVWFAATVVVVAAGLVCVCGWAFDLTSLPKFVWIGGVFVALAISKYTADRWRSL